MNEKKPEALRDEQLVQQVLQGDNAAFGRIIKNTEGLVAQIVYKMIDNAEDRRDLAQDIYLKAFKNLPGFRFQARLSTWIAQISYRSCLNFLEKKKLVLTDHPDEEIADGTESATSLTQKELSRVLQTEIAKLSPIYRTLVTLFHKEELSYAEIAEITQLPEGTIKNYLYRARKTLKENILINYNKEAL